MIRTGTPTGDTVTANDPEPVGLSLHKAWTMHVVT